MTKPKFTQGPWLADPANNRVSDSQRRIVSYTARNNSESLQERIASTHLIAAAPDMYEALESAISHLKETDDYEREDGGLITIMVEECEAALSKARGERV